MSATTPATFQELYTDAGQRLRVNVSDSTTAEILKRYINLGNHDIYANHNWPWSERRSVLLTNAVYNTGTIAIAAGARTTVTGDGTAWNTAVTGMGFNNTRVGGKLKIGSEIYTVDAVGGDTAITLASRYIGAELTAASYTYFEDEYALATDFKRPIDLRQFSQEFTLPIIGRQEFYRKYPANGQPGRPVVCTVLDLGPSTTAAPVYKVLLHPAPDAIYQIPYRYQTRFISVSSAGVQAVDMSANGDEPILPLRYRQALVFYAISQWYRDRKDDTRSQSASAEYVDIVTRMAGDYTPEADRPKFRTSHTRARYLAGAAGPRRSPSGRYATGSWFDELR